MEKAIGSRIPEQDQGVAHLHSVSYDLFILVLTIFSQGVVAGLIVGTFSPAVDDILLRVDFVICAVFLIDFFVNLQRDPDKTGYFFRRGGWLDLLGAIPYVPGLRWTVLFRMARLNRLVRIVKHLQGKDRNDVLAEARRAPARTVLLTTIWIAILLITVASLFVLRFEEGAPGASIKTGDNAFWWALVTITTVGYGDFVPVTFPGRVVAMFLMVFGVGIFVVLTNFVAARLDGFRHDGEDGVAILREENAIIRAELAEIKDLLQQHNSTADGDTYAEEV
jgi:voltage-gated potassium channel